VSGTFSSILFEPYWAHLRIDITLSSSFTFVYLHPKPLVIKQESTNYDVTASELSSPLCLIIDVVCMQTSKKGMQLTIFYRLLTIIIDY